MSPPRRVQAKALVSVALLLSLQVVTAWPPHIVTKGNKFFDSESGLEFRLKGMAYYPRPNAGELYDVNNYDWASDDHEDVWQSHIKIMQELGVNTVRLYSVDPSKSHDKFMCACAEAGIYVLIGITAPCENCSILDEKPPACYPSELLTRAQMVYNAFAVYDNTLGFSVGNENNLQKLHGADGTVTAPCVKAFLRDVRRYAKNCAGSMRAVPIGLDIADIPPRPQWIQYYDCSVDNDECTRAEWVGFNPYVECDPVNHTVYEDSTGLRELMQEYASTAYSRPIMFGEFGCNLGKHTLAGYENQRSFYDAKWMNEEKEMTDEIVGGNVFEFSTEKIHLAGQVLSRAADPGKFGVGFFQPDNCDHAAVACKFIKYPEFDNLQRAYTTTLPSNVSFESFSPTRTDVLSCPSTMSTDLPPMPQVETLECPTRQPVCHNKKSNAFEKDPTQKLPLGSAIPPTNASPTVPTPSKGSHTSAAAVGQAGSHRLLIGLVLLLLSMFS